jgi:hypothetical protein
MWVCVVALECNSMEPPCESDRCCHRTLALSPVELCFQADNSPLKSNLNALPYKRQRYLQVSLCGPYNGMLTYRSRQP